MACQIKRNSNGIITQVLAPNGKDSILYRDIVNNLTNPQTLAQVKQDPYVNMVLGTEYIKGTDVSEVGLAAWSKAYSADFINQFGDWKTQTIANTDVNGEPNVDVLFPDLKVSNIKEGVDFVFEQNPELANIGTQEQYSEYLDTVFPDSMVKQIMYHGSPIGKIAEIDKRFAITYWSTTLEYVRSSNLWKNNITQAILNIRNPLFTNKLLASAPPEVTEFLSPAYTSEEYDSVIGVDAGQQLVGGKTIAVKNKQVDTHILGSKKDIEGFKKFVKSTQQVSGMSSILNLINMKRWTQTKNNCPKL